MRKLTKHFLLTGALMSVLQSALAFVPIGPVGNGSDSWQVTGFGYNPLAPLNFTGIGNPSDTGPKNIGQGFRPNVPVFYYTFDTTFLGYFGSSGTNAVNGAFSILNGLTNVDNYSAGLTEFPFDSSSINGQAYGLDLIDLKSLTLTSLMGYLGLEDAVRYTWTLHSRWHIGSVACPVGENYAVVQRNLDITTSSVNQFQYTPYVNGALYTYLIWESCPYNPNPFPSIEAQVVPFAADNLNDAPPVSSGLGFGDLNVGRYYTGLTRDDVAGLRYMLTAANVNVESPATNSLLQTSTLGPVTTIQTANLATLLAAAQEVPAATLETLFPGVEAVPNPSVPWYYTNLVTYSTISYFTNFVGAANGAPPTLVTTVVPTTNFYQVFNTTLLNIVTNTYYTTAKASIMTVSNLPSIGSAAGSPLILHTNFTAYTITNYPSGDYYIIPSNTCGWSIIAPLATSVVATTNTFGDVATNAYGYVYYQTLVIYSTNHVYEVQQINCGGITPPAAQYEGIERMQFVYVDPRNFDTASGQFVTPITNNYTMSEVVFTNNQNVVVIQNFQRVLTSPDFQFSATDLLGTGGAENIVALEDPQWNVANVLPGAAGPGTINPGGHLSFNNSGVIAGNVWPFTTGPNDELGGSVYFNYGSFDGTTNAPVVYPNGTSIGAIQNQVFIQILPAALPDATNKIPYSATISVIGGQAPYTWSLPSGSVLPSGLTLSSGGQLSGISTQIGVFDFVVQMNDSAGHIVQKNYTLTVH